MAKQTTSLDDEKARPLGDTGDGQTGVPAGEQGISNRPGDTDDEDEDDFEDDADGDEAEDEDEESSPA